MYIFLHWKFIFIFGNYTIQGFEILWLCINYLSSFCVSMYQKHDFKLEWITCWEKWDNPGSENLISLVTWDFPCSLLTGWLMRSCVRKIILRQDFPNYIFLFYIIKFWVCDVFSYPSKTPIWRIILKKIILFIGLQTKQRLLYSRVWAPRI